LEFRRNVPGVSCPHRNTVQDLANKVRVMVVLTNRKSIHQLDENGINFNIHLINSLNAFLKEQEY
jgi:hypothetical protein